MKKIVLLLSLILLCGAGFSSASAQAPAYLGEWKVNEVGVEQTIDGKTASQKFKNTKSLNTFNEAPKKISITSKKIIFEYQDGRIKTADYKADEKNINVEHPTHLESLGYKLIDSNKLELVSEVFYTKENSETVRETYTYYITKN